MIYSVWRPHLKRYDYFEAPARPEDIEVPHPGHLSRATSRVGATPEEAAWSLPSSARPVGSGTVPKGMIAVEPGAVALGGLPPPRDLVLYGLVAYGLYRILS